MGILSALLNHANSVGDFEATFEHKLFFAQLKRLALDERQKCTTTSRFYIKFIINNNKNRNCLIF